MLTHCNAGALACVGYGTALGVIRAAHEAGQACTVWVDETRPVLQGARLTAWELAGSASRTASSSTPPPARCSAPGEVDAVVVGADRIAANGDVANKIGTYPLAVLADAHNVPFYVAAPDHDDRPGHPDGAAIPIEERAGAEVTTSAARASRPRARAATTRRST